MNKQLLVDIIPVATSPLMILEAKVGGKMRLKGKLQEADQKNGNGRVYPKDILMKEMNRYLSENVKTRTAMGELDHPDSEVVNLANVSHLITNVWWEGNDVMGELELLNTPSGKIAQEIITSGIPLGISSRAMGSVKQMSEGTVEVKDDLAIIGFDLVSNPSTPNAYMKLSEGKIYQQTNHQNRINELITDIICTRTGFCSCEIK